ncbi:toll/interleukin-1 receptor domain-containing protein [Mesorhizobium sp. KR9-304]|uniref:toll/interleukin-1 receptor domain-containing protein n=1 Tax=Mesorhizobium sp. KR9-304 TaxID=3156614 RepID=UPI0032B388A4
MFDVFISYAREDAAHAKRLYDALCARGLTVWWDGSLLGGQDFRKSIPDILRGVKRVVVIWSKNSVGSDFVRDEADAARQDGKLVPISIDDAAPPMGFRGIHTIKAKSIDESIDSIVAAIDSRPFTATKVARWRIALLAWHRPVLLTLAGVGIGVASYHFLGKAPQQTIKMDELVEVPGTTSLVDVFARIDSPARPGIRNNIDSKFLKSGDKVYEIRQIEIRQIEFIVLPR